MARRNPHPPTKNTTATKGTLIVICYGCAGARTDPKGGPCRRCHGTGIDPNP